jgi:hypothetical protein
VASSPCGALARPAASWNQEAEKSQINFENPRLPNQSWVFRFWTPRSWRDQLKNLKGNMKKRINQVPTRFGRQTRFDVVPVPAVPFRGPQETDLELLKNRLLVDLLQETADPALNATLRRAATEAAGLAWFTPFPLLFFPGLLEEKALAARSQQFRQRQIRRSTRDLLEKASN